MPLLKNKRIKLFPKREINRSIWTDDDETQPTSVNLDTLYRVFEECSELYSIINVLVTDILSDGFDIVAQKDSGGVTKKSKRMEKHLLQINFYKKLERFLIHTFITGDGYFEIKRIPNISKSIKNIVNKFQFISKDEISEIYKNIDEEIIFPFNIWNIKSSTMEMAVDKTGQPLYYVQKVDGNEIKFSPDQIIHFSLTNLGSVYSIPPTYPLLDDIATLLSAKHYAGKFFENGGIPNNIFVIKNGRGLEDRNYQVLKTEIREMRNKKNWQKNLVLTGDVEVQKLNEFNKDLEFRNLIELMTHRLLMAYGVPPIRLGIIDKKSNNKEMTEGYWKRINFLQKEIEELLNNKIFNNYGLYFKFRRSYKIDEIREAQIVSILYDRGLITSREARLKMGYVNDINKNEAPPVMRGNDLPYRDMGDRQEGGRGRGVDVGAKLVSPANKEMDLRKSLDILEVSFNDFVNIVEKLVPFNEAKIFYKKTIKDNVIGYELYFSDQVFKYKSFISEELFLKNNYNLSYWIEVR